MALKNVISISGGKDSTAMLLLALERDAPEMVVVFADTGHEHPETYRYIDYLERATGVAIRRVMPDFSRDFERKRSYIAEHWPEDIRQRAIEALVPTGIPFLDLAMLKGRFPSTKAKFCTEHLKVLPIQQQVDMPLLAAGHDVVSWQGVRRDESPARSRLGEWEELDLGVMAYRPILDWDVERVFAMHRKHGIEPNPLYSQGMSRVGCMPCIHARKQELREIASRFPEEIERVAEWERIVSRAAKRGVATFWAARGEADVSLMRHGIHSAVEWSRTTRGGRQFDLIAATSDGNTECSSVYGLCE
ncbi:phosphoadenosine phosphosulfate reductase family protein [Halomonas caseinilytica]|uniref:3'-phosphoadenosine 5'-phosphosulfate sulfotransferase (PAPS reductase)/FAD synthetase n=1 Tax=Halomonas caseinilytica TaxID=438744 RepID=A0A1M6T7H0_9GAMM|nr:phosphoadenosine phosphosulfate reductase family protein [Halomonas caseinilytica]SHK52937.1 3'-phosphoadenosine 5'-phosphosulfate sulfotransferase (PAPS reductase)/FAD synthetase [Halomonas caseinilytica]